MTAQYVRWFSEISNADVSIAGGKNASLGEMYRELSSHGVPVPNGFAVTAQGYRRVLDAAGAWTALHGFLDGIESCALDEFSERCAGAHTLVRSLPLPADLTVELTGAYHRLLGEYGGETGVAVRSSATAEDLPSASFAGQHESFLNVTGDAMLLEAYSACIASLFLERAVHYRIDRGFDHFKVALSVGVMKMVRSDLASSGVAFTLDTESGFRDVVFVTASYGLGENVVQGTVDPDEFYVHKPTFEAGFRAVLRRRIGGKEKKLVFAPGGKLGSTTANVETGATERRAQCISDDDVLEIAAHAIVIERHYGVPMDVEWAKDGIDGTIFIVQARPETAVSQRPLTAIDEYRMKRAATPLVQGRAVGAKIASGEVRIVADERDLAAFRDGEVLVAPTTTPDWEPVMKRAAAIVTDRGGRTCHAAIVARELGIPAVVGTGSATAALRGIGAVTVSCAQGETGSVYSGKLPFEVEHVDISALPQLPVQVELTLADPDAAFELSRIPNDGVGLARIEFIVSESIGAHPMALAHPERLDAQTAEKIAALTAGYDQPADFFVQRLAEGVATIAAAFYPKPVVVRFSDFKSNEYASLLGGAPFERPEQNPMLGFRGAARYVDPAYADGFALECAAMRQVRERFGLTNAIVMVPFCRRVQEAANVLARMEALGLHRGAGGLKVFMMCEIPNNVIQMDAFAQYFDGFSIGSNDLAQLILGVDRDSELVAYDFDERDPGVLEMLRSAIAGAHRNGRRIGICGQAPSDYPDVALFLMDAGIDAISLNPDSVVRTVRRLARTRSGKGYSLEPV